MFELFSAPPSEYLREIDRCVPHWSIEFSPESHDQAVRNAQEGEADYSTEAMEAMIAEALRLRCERFDVFFMIGLPGQTLESVRGTIDYCEHLFRLGDRRLSCYISPMGPFLDPQPRLRGARALRLPPVRPDARGAPPVAGAADLGAHPQLRDAVDDAPRARGRDL